jgi:hypothetical protein
MLKAGIAGAWEDQLGDTKLANPSKTLKQRNVNERSFPPFKMDRLPDRIVDVLRVSRNGGTRRQTTAYELVYRLDEFRRVLR